MRPGQEEGTQPSHTAAIWQEESARWVQATPQQVLPAPSPPFHHTKTRGRPRNPASPTPALGSSITVKGREAGSRR